MSAVVLEEYLIFVLARELYAVPLISVHEVVRPGPITPVPRARVDIAGVMSLRGRLVSVLDLRRSIHVAAVPLDGRHRVIVLELDDEDVGFLVEDVRGVERFSEHQMESASALAGVEKPHLRGVARRGNEMLIILDLLSLIPGRSLFRRELQ
jgi:purine-binding chemotaxis protein CheW